MTSQHAAEEHDRNGKCIICKTLHERRSRGLCMKHYARFQAALDKIPLEKRDEFEAELIAAGMLLPSRKGQKVRPEDDEFQVAAAKFTMKADSGRVSVSGQQADLRKTPATAEEIAAELVESAKKATREAKKKPAMKPKSKKG